MATTPRIQELLTEEGLEEPEEATAIFGEPWGKAALYLLNAPELLSQLIAVLDKEGLDDAVNQIRMKKIPQIIDQAWRSRGKEVSAARVARAFSRRAR